MRQAELTKLTKKWQEILTLQDWSITPVLVDSDAELQDSDDAANIMWDHENGEAQIWILKPERQLEVSAVMVSVEETLVHELLHLRLEGHKAPYRCKRDTAYEKALNKIAAALVRKRRR